MTYKIFNISDFRKAIRAGAYAWPGGYPLYFVMADCEALSFEAAKENKREILTALRDNANNNFPDKQWLIIGIDINYEDNELYCSHSNKKIECAYPPD